jgi:DNA-directed RNA polymerase subunit RPC12/RpoP
MTESSISVSCACKKCGAKIQWEEEASDATEISCPNCGEHVGSYGDLKETAVDAANSKVDEMLKDIFKAD